MASYQSCAPSACTVWGVDPETEVIDGNCYNVINLQALRDLPATLGFSPDTIFIRGHTYPGDGGGGAFVKMPDAPSGTWTDDDGIWALQTGSDGSTGYKRAGVGFEIPVWWYGVVDDSVNGTPALQSCLDYIGANGGTVLLPSRLRMDTRASVRFSGITIRGPGGRGLATDNQGCWIRPGAPFGTAMLRFDRTDSGPASRGCAIENVCFWGYDRVHAIHSALAIEGSDDITVTNVQLREINGIALELLRCWNGTFRGLHFEDCGGVGDGRSAIFFDSNEDDFPGAGFPRGNNFYGIYSSNHHRGRAAMEIRQGTDNNFIGGAWITDVNDDEIMSPLAFIYCLGDRNSFSDMRFDSHEVATQAKVIIDGNDCKMSDCVFQNVTPDGQLQVNGASFSLTQFTMTVANGGSTITPQLDLYGGSLSISNGVITHGFAIRIGGNDNKITDLIVDSPEHGYGFVINGDRCIGSDLHVLDPFEAGIVVDGNYSELSSCYLSGTSEHGIQVRGFKNKVSGCTVLGGTGYGIDTTGDECTIDGCVLQSINGTGIYVASQAVVVTNCQVNASDHGIDVGGGAGHVVNNNRIDSAGTSTPGIYSGIRVAGAAGNNGTIVGNQIGTNSALETTLGILVDVALDYWLVVGNNARLGGGVTANGANNIVESNLV